MIQYRNELEHFVYSQSIDINDSSSELINLLQLDSTVSHNITIRITCIIYQTELLNWFVEKVIDNGDYIDIDITSDVYEYITSNYIDAIKSIFDDLMNLVNYERRSVYPCYINNEK